MAYKYFQKLNSPKELSDGSLIREWHVDPILNVTVSFTFYAELAWRNSRELKQPRRRRQQEPHKFAYLTMKNSIFARFARAFFIFWHFEDVLVLSRTWNDQFCSCVDDVTIWWQMFNFVFLCSKGWFQFNSRIVRTHFSSKTVWITEKWLQKREVTLMTFSLSSTSCLLKLPNNNGFIGNISTMYFFFYKLNWNWLKSNVGFWEEGKTGVSGAKPLRTDWAENQQTQPT